MEDVFNLDGTQASKFLEKENGGSDGLLRPKLEEGKDGKRELVIRFLPNLMKNGKIGPTAVTKHIHYADFKQNPELQGYFDCLKNDSINKECPLCKTYWALKNSKNPEDNDKAKLINRTTKYYSYVYVVEDKQVPENEGKIFIFPFGYKIFQKIETKAKSSRRPVKVEDLIHGANLNLVIQEVGGYYNYDASEFETPEPIEIDGIPLAVEKDGSISKEEKKRVVDFLMSREFELETFNAQDWTPEQYDTVDKIVALLTNSQYTGNSSRANQGSPVLTSASVFETDEDEDEDETPVVESKPARSSRTKTVEPEITQEEPQETSVKDARKKASAFFDDEDED
jgi:hypothetical protein